MLQRSPRVFSVALAIVLLSGRVAGPGTVRAEGPGSDGLVAHEWGTFTTVAGENGDAVQWIPLGGPTDLPCFVYTFKGRSFKGLQPSRQLLLPEQTLGPIGSPLGRPLDYLSARAGLKGTVRMETPVLYFYAPRAMSVNVQVQFERGLFTEWYPNALVAQPQFFENLLTTSAPTSVMDWRNVTVDPSPSARPGLLTEPEPSHYYAARETDAAAIDVNGEEEKFLFYRGVAGFPPPITTTLDANGAIAIRNRSDAVIPRVLLFTKKDGRFAWRAHGPLGAKEQVVLTTNASSASNAASSAAQNRTDGTASSGRTFLQLRAELERLLVAEGLYAKEAQAMVETWRDSWFEDGTRVFYLVPPTIVDTILPLRITPTPSAVVRVFVGRMDVITPAEIRAVETAFAKRDRTTLEAHGRLLGPIADRILARTSDAGERANMSTQLDRALAAHLADVMTCEAPSSPHAPVPTSSLAPSLAPSNLVQAPALQR